MKRILALALLMTGCAAVPVVPGDAANAEQVELEVAGQVTDACHVPDAQPTRTIILRAAGELDALATTQTDSRGGYRFQVAAPATAARRLYIETNGRKALANQRYGAERALTADLNLPCG